MTNARSAAQSGWVKNLFQEAAAALDVDAAPLMGAAPWPRQDGPQQFRNASDIPRLTLYWDAVVAAELVSLTATRAYPTKVRAGFPQRLQIKPRRGSAQDRTGHVPCDPCVGDGQGHQEPELGHLTRYFLLEAAVEPISVKVLKHPVRGLDDFDPREDRTVHE